MNEQKTLLGFEGVNDSIYAGFWIRLGSLLLDFIVMLPYFLLLLAIHGLSKNAYYFTFIPSLIFNVWFNIYLVKKYGGTPGKLILGLKILKLDGTTVTWKEAVLRHVVNFILALCLTLMTLYALSIADVEYYDSLGWMEKQKYLFGLTPTLFQFYNWTNNIWFYSELFVILFNKRKRAIHDFIAGTVIVKKKYLNIINDTMISRQVL